MICAIRQSDRVKVVAEQTTKAEAPFNCPDCAKDVIVRKCRTKIDHFAHRPPVTCQYGAGETELHRRCKTEIFDALRTRSGVEKLELERHLGDIRPDLSGYINGVRTAIEVQISALAYDIILRRTEAYARKKIYLLWLSPWNSALDENERYAPKLWERWCHAAYFGRVYYWTGGSRVVPYHFDPYLLHVPYNEWHGEGGEEMSSGGFDRFSKKFKTLARGKELDLATDFVAAEKNGFTGGQIVVPPCRLFKDRSRRFDDLRLQTLPMPSSPPDFADDDAPWI